MGEGGFDIFEAKRVFRVEACIAALIASIPYLVLLLFGLNISFYSEPDKKIYTTISVAILYIIFLLVAFYIFYTANIRRIKAELAKQHLSTTKFTRVFVKNEKKRELQLSGYRLDYEELYAKIQDDVVIIMAKHPNEKRRHKVHQVNKEYFFDYYSVMPNDQEEIDQEETEN